jgi:REP element-mobilizing transposase RayT
VTKRYDPDIHHRRSVRLQTHDYARRAASFVTICSHEREYLFGGVLGDVMRPNVLGRAVIECWEALPAHFCGVTYDAFIVMPNHVHAILVLGDVAAPADDAKAQPAAPLSPSLGSIIGSFKSAAARSVNRLRFSPAAPVWQRNYYEHIVRNESELACIRRYVTGNPASWREDEYYVPIRVP